MRRKLTLLTTALAFGLGTTAALAEDAPGAKNDITVVQQSTDDASAMQKDEGQAAPDAGAPAQDDGGAAVQQEPPKSDENSSSNY
jgi:hypothetical protein